MILTIGHGAKQINYFISELRAAKIKYVLDCRSTPYSRWHGQFNRNALAKSLAIAGIEYRFLGANLGGKLHNTRHDQTLDEVAKEFGTSKIKFAALLCSETSPGNCHRLELASKLMKRGAKTVRHIVNHQWIRHETTKQNQLF